MAGVVEPVAWESLGDEELLRVRMCDLGLKIEGSEIEPRVQKLFAALEERKIPVRPKIYLGDEWLSPTDVPAIAIPFYLAHPRLKQLELRQMMEVEGGTPEWCDKLLFHECGHAIDHAYGLSKRRTWKAVFGDPAVDYHPEVYKPRPYSRAFVRHLPNWYAQAHPDEDFAETFAVWLALSPEQWKLQYEGWKALEKLEYVDKVMREAIKKPPRRTGGRFVADASKLKKTLARHYAARRKLWESDYPDFYDQDLRKIFGELHAGRRERRALHEALPEIHRHRDREVDRRAQDHRRHARTEVDLSRGNVEPWDAPRRARAPPRHRLLSVGARHQLPAHRHVQEECVT